MKYKKHFTKVFVILIIFIVFTLTANINAYASTNAIDNEKLNQELNFSYNSILVVINKEKSLEFKNYTFSDFIESVDGEVIELTEYSTMIVKEKVNNSGSYSNIDINIENFRRILLLKFSETQNEDSILEYIELLRNHVEIDYVGPDFISNESAIEPNDFEYREDNQWAIDSLELPETWEFTKGNEDVVVGVIDTGIDGSHEDLDEPTNNNLHRDFSGNETIALETPVDSDEHGTHVAGIIGAESNNEIGVSGTCWDITLVSLRINVGGAWYSSRVIRAVDYAIAAGIDVLNYSGRTRNEENNVAPYDDPALAQMIHLYPGLFICAAGNYNNNNDEIDMFPANYTLSHDNVISVGAYNELNERWSFSNYGEETVSIFAPGEDIVSCIPGDDYDSFSGTSMATPYVTGVVALLLSIDENLTTAQVRESILESAIPLTINIGGSSTQDVVRLNAYEAVKYVLEHFSNTTYTLSNYSSAINTNKTITSDASYFDELNGFYKLNVTYDKSYEFISSSTSVIDVTLYDEDFTEIPFNDLDSTSNKVHFIKELNTGTYYLRTKYDNEESTGTINTKIVSRTTAYLGRGDNDILVNTYNNIDEYNFINSWGAGFYKFTIEAITSNGSSILYPNETLKIYDHMNEYQEDKYNVKGYSQDAENISGANYLYMYLERDGYYYIHIDLPSLDYSEVILNIERVSVDEIDVASRYDEEFTEPLITSNDMTEYAVGFSIDQTSMFELSATTSETYSGNITLVLFRKEYNSNTHTYYRTDILGDYLSITSEELILEEGTYYVGFFGNTSNVPVTVTIDRIVNTSEITDQVLVMDPSYALPYGTEVRHNGGGLEGTTITEGFTRHVHFKNVTGVPSVERQDYNFYSSNTSYATVSEFGTVFAKSVSQDREVTITAVYKYNPAIIFTIDLVIVNDTSNTPKVIETTQTISLSKFVDGKYKLVLDEHNSPYPWIQYFNWSIYVPCQKDDILVTMDNYGFLTTSGVGSATLTGEYTINPNVTIIIHINFVE